MGETLGEEKPRQCNFLCKFMNLNRIFGGAAATAVEPSLAPTVARRAALIPYWVCELERRLFTSSSFALWAGGRLNALLRIDSDTLLIGMYAKLSPDSC